MLELLSFDAKLLVTFCSCLFVAAAVAAGGADGEPLPRPRRRRNRPQEDRGLPSDEELARLAKVYLERQRNHWPRLADAGVFPEPTDTVLAEMVEDFKRRHRSGKVDTKYQQLLTNSLPAVR